jgi:hypothetical protein
MNMYPSPLIFLPNPHGGALALNARAGYELTERAEAQ